MNSTPSFFKVLLCLLVVCAVGLSGIWWQLGRDAAEKIGTAMMMPAGLLWLLQIALVIQLWPLRRPERRTPGGWGALLCLFVYSLGGSGIVSDTLARTLEAPYVGTNPLEEEPLDVVVVLGGGGGTGANGRLQGNSSGDRMILAAQLYHLGVTSKFICTGQRIASMNSTGTDPAETSRDILTKLGVPDSAIELSGGKNTSEEMLNLGKRFEGSSERIGLLTSAWHLPRATRLAARNGLNVISLPSDFRSSPPQQAPTIGQRVESLIPNGAAFGSTWSFVKEYVGMLLGR